MPNDLTEPPVSEFERLYPDGDARASKCAETLVATSELLLNNIASLLRPLDLTPASGLVLSILADAEDPLPPHEIAERLIVSRATVTGLVDSLESRGLAQRRPHPTDRRMLLVAITERGRQRAHEFRPIVHRHHRTSFEVLDDGETGQLTRLLERIQAQLRSLGS